MASIGNTVSIHSRDSLLSIIVTLYTLILLYLPQLIFSPTLILTIILLFSVLRLGNTQCSAIEQYILDSNQLNHNSESELSSRCQPGPDPDPDPDPDSISNSLYADSFVEWDVRAPLEVIHEGHEGEEAELNHGIFEENRNYEMNIIQRYASLSMFYPESDSDDSSEGDFQAAGDWSSLENVFFRWEDEDGGGEGLIEIALDDRKRCSEVDEDNMIEIDLSPER